MRTKVGQVHERTHQPSTERRSDCREPAAQSWQHEAGNKCWDSAQEVRTAGDAHEQKDETADARFGALAGGCDDKQEDGGSHEGREQRHDKTAAQSFEDATREGHKH